MALYPITVNTPVEALPHIYAEDDAAIYESISGGDGVYDIGEMLKATVLSNNNVRIGNGVLSVGGHIARIKYGDYEEMTIDNGESGKNRNDLIVARFSTTGFGGVDEFSLEVKKGVAVTGAAKDPEIETGNLYEGETIREFPLHRVRLEGISIVAVDQLFAVRKTNEQLQKEVDELNRKFVFKRRNSSEAGICTPHYIMIMGTLVLQGANADYRQLFSTSDLLSKLKFYDPSISNFEEAKCVVTTNNGDGNAAATHFYAPEWWGSNNAYYQYFYPGTSSPIRVNYCIHYLKL